MKSTVSRVVRTMVVLELNLEEAKWLNSVMQNPLNGCPPN